MFSVIAGSAVGATESVARIRVEFDAYIVAENAGLTELLEFIGRQLPARGREASAHWVTT
jgi:hypothetical protein